MIDDSEFDFTEEYAYLITSRDHDDALSFYETEKYEIVRCSITMQDNGEVVKGLTYRFAGSP